MIYKFKPGYPASGKIDAESAATVLEAIRESHGGYLRTTDVVAAAAVADSPIHEAFTWNDAVAANAFRLAEARQLIRGLVVIRDDQPEPQQAYWHVTVAKSEESDGDRYYQSATVIAKSPIEYASALNLMRKELVSAQKGLQELLQLAPRSDRHKVKTASQHIEKAQQALSP